MKTKIKFGIGFTVEKTPKLWKFELTLVAWSMSWQYPSSAKS